MVAAVGGLKNGERVLVNGVSGGVGSVLVQVIKGKGVEVMVVCSEGNKGFVMGLGADEHVDYWGVEPDLEGWLEGRFRGEEERKLDYIFDCVRRQMLFDRLLG